MLTRIGSRTAHHEAGHIVVGAALGWPVRSAFAAGTRGTRRRGERAGQVLWARRKDGRPWDWEGRPAAERLVVAVAGYAAADATESAPTGFDGQGGALPISAYVESLDEWEWDENNKDCDEDRAVAAAIAMLGGTARMDRVLDLIHWAERVALRIVRNNPDPYRGLVERLDRLRGRVLRGPELAGLLAGVTAADGELLAELLRG
jgi:hypothetical protein